MFGKKKGPPLRKDLPAIDLTRKPVKGLFGRTKWVHTTKREQRQIKAGLMAQHPDRYYVDDLNEWNSIKPRDELSWIDDLEAFDAFMDDS
jgi:hypothetical protein